MNVSWSLRLLVSTAALIVAPHVTHSQVNWQNGNYNVSYDDIELEGLVISRTYNSKSTASSIFGYGWGWIGETRLVPLADGSVNVIHWGGGLSSTFPAPFPSEAMIGNAIREIVAGRVALGWEADLDETAAFRVELRENLERRSIWSRLLADSLDIRRPENLFGTRWTSSPNHETLLRVNNGYTLVRTEGDTLEFNDHGRLTRTGGDSDGLAISYDGRGRVAVMSSKLTGASAVFGFDGRGLLKSVVATGRSGTVQRATYEHNERGDVAESTDAGGNRYRYTFDDLHNLTRIDYDDGSFRSVTYDPTSSYATRVSNRDGSWIEYDYYGGDNLYGTRVTVRDSAKVTQRSRAEWEIRAAEDGRRFTWRYLIEEGDTLTEEFYGECCGDPVRVRKKTPAGETVTHFDGKGNIVRP